MALKSYKPTTPGQRGLVLIDRSELWKGRPVKSLTEGLTVEGRAQQHRTDHHAPARRRGEAPLPHRRLQAHQARRRGQGHPDRVRSEPDRVHRADRLCRRRAELHPGAAAARGRRHGDRGGQGRHQAGQRDAVHLDADRHDRAQRRDEAGQGRPDRPLGRHLRPVRRPRRRLRADPAVVGRAAHGAPGMHGDGRRGVEPRQLEPEHRQGRAQPAEGHPPARPRRRDEPDRPPARRRRRPHLAAAGIRSPPGASRPRARARARTRRRRSTSCGRVTSGRRSKEPTCHGLSGRALSSTPTS